MNHTTTNMSNMLNGLMNNTTDNKSINDLIQISLDMIKDQYEIIAILESKSIVKINEDEFEILTDELFHRDITFKTVSIGGNSFIMFKNEKEAIEFKLKTG